MAAQRPVKAVKQRALDPAQGASPPLRLVCETTAEAPPMTADRAPPVPAADDVPVQGFAHCHAGIVAQLRELEQLPALAEAAARSRRVAKATQNFYREVVLTHHSEEEQELFSAVLASAERGAERDRVQAIVTRLTQEHRHIESLWRTIDPALRDVAHGRDTVLDAHLLATFVADYRAHAQYEEEVFLPLCSTILGRNGDHMAALGVSLHARHAMPEVLRRFGTHL
jgi:Hemerythrin HHE cation binding domain